ncbi:MAG: STAS domain-containing protein [Planctomycetota bacterium]
MNQSEATLITLSGSIGVAEIAELHTGVVRAAEEGRKITFDFSETRDVDASILQLLLASSAAAKKDVATISLRGVSDSLAESFESFGAGEILSMVEGAPPMVAVPTEQAG